MLSTASKHNSSKLIFDFVEFNRPHQIIPEARDILLSSLKFPTQNAQEAPIAFGFPVRCISKGDTTVAEYDKDYPIPEVLVISGGRMTPGSEDHVSSAVMANCIRWMNLHIEQPHGLEDGLALSRRIASRHTDKHPHMNMMLWYFRDFISTCVWEPKITDVCLGRSTIDGNKDPVEIFIQVRINQCNSAGPIAAMLASQRQ